MPRNIFIAFFILMHSWFCQAQVINENNKIITKNYSLTIDPNNGTLISFKRNNTEFIHQNKIEQNLFKIKLRDERGKAIDLSSLEAKTISISKTAKDKKNILKIKYSAINKLPVTAEVTIESLPDDPLTYWDIKIENSTGHFIDNVDFPLVSVNSDLIGSGGKARIFRPWAEGELIENLDIRNDSWWKPTPVEYPNNGGVAGIYPGDCNMQFMAYYKNNEGLYLAAHDKESNMKGIDYFPQKDSSILFDFRLFPGAPMEKYSMPYKMVLGGFSGDWYDAADIYRRWVESVPLFKMPKLIENKRIPEWYTKSPVVVTYPVRGTQDMGDMTPNEYYPYTKALPTIDNLSKAFDSNILTLLMHWEGSAPWAPPYLWPPYGDTSNFKKFVGALHQNGNAIGLYGSGTGYTIRSNTDTTYNRYKEWEEKNIKEIVTIAPDGSLCMNGACTGPNAQRMGHDMCPVNPFVKNVVHKEVEYMLQNGIDYCQFFDQLMGGNCYSCYSKKHPHPPAPAKWMSEAMVDIYKDLQQMVDRSGKKMLIGCEEAASEPFIPYLALNDSRYNLTYSMGNPVPAYAYVYHEYINNFMGNQVCSSFLINYEKSPYNFLQRISQSFVAGDLLTVVLAGKGKINWDWGSKWDTKMPDQEAVKILIKNLNQWRKEDTKKYLVFGRMEKPFEVLGAYDIPMVTNAEKEIHNSSVFTSKWRSQQGELAQILVNYTGKPQSLELVCKGYENKNATILNSPISKPLIKKINLRSKLPVIIAPYSAVLVELK